MTVVAHTIFVEGFLTNPAVRSSLEGDGVTVSHDDRTIVFKIAGDLPLNLWNDKRG